MIKKNINQTFRKINLDEQFDDYFNMNSIEFKNAYKILSFYGVNFDEDVLLQIETTPDAMIALLVEYQRLMINK
jgi:nucleosome binding factor SPN SPT16 subunit